jgi:putative ABC transport system permease protein
MILREGARLAAIGIVAGQAAAIAAGRRLSGLLYNVRPNDAGVLVLVPAVLGLVALLATLIPARRASRVDPAIAMRDA